MEVTTEAYKEDLLSVVTVKAHLIILNLPITMELLRELTKEISLMTAKSRCQGFTKKSTV